MLIHLEIENYLLVKKLSLDFSKGLSVITGETGAGKSMILGALDVLLGEKFPKDAIRPGAQKAILEGTFRIETRALLKEMFSEGELEEFQGELLFRREISAQGRTRSYLNDHPIPLEKLLQIREMLADFHGQREHQTLFDPSRQLEFLDAFAATEKLAESFSVYFGERSALKKQLDQISTQLAAQKKEQALLSYQLEEIERLGLKSGEEEEIKTRLNKLESGEKLAVELGKLQQILSESDLSMSVASGQARALSNEIRKIDSEFSSIAAELANIESAVKDLALQVRDYSDSLSFDEQELNKLRDRRGVLWDLKRKHGLDLEQILARAGELKTMLSQGEALEKQFEALSIKLDEMDTELCSQADKLSALRHKAAKSFSHAVTDLLKPLGFPSPEFSAELATISKPFIAEKISRSGADGVEFIFTANPGSKPAPISKIASGGESSRLTLAIKSVLAEKINYPLMVYDEIDSGISGKVADQVGDALAKLAANHQVIVITHLPQIASKADQHLVVEKITGKQSTETTARFLDKAERVAAISELLAGAKITDKTLASADELLKQSEKTKRDLHKVG